MPAVPGPPPGPCDAKAAVAHSKPVAAKAKRDIAWLMRDDAMTISRDEGCRERKCCRAKLEPVRAMRIHQYGAAIHFTFTSLTLDCDLRCGEAADQINRTALA
jgi:hypothetical protein